MSNNGDAFNALQREIDRIRELGSFAKDVAPDVADELRTQIEAQIARGEGPDGKPWQLTAKGTRPLRNAASALNVRAIGTTILVSLTGPEALHHWGVAAGRIKRQIIPTRQLPDRVIKAIRAVVSRAFADRTGGK